MARPALSVTIGIVFALFAACASPPRASIPSQTATGPAPSSAPDVYRPATIIRANLVTGALSPEVGLAPATKLAGNRYLEAVAAYRWPQFASGTVRC